MPSVFFLTFSCIVYSDEGNDTAAEMSVYVLYNDIFSWSEFWDTFSYSIVSDYDKIF